MMGNKPNDRKHHNINEKSSACFFYYYFYTLFFSEQSVTKGSAVLNTAQKPKFSHTLHDSNLKDIIP